jgi:hypothetical protein
MQRVISQPVPQCIQLNCFKYAQRPNAAITRRKAFANGLQVLDESDAPSGRVHWHVGQPSRREHSTCDAALLCFVTFTLTEDLSEAAQRPN